MDDSDAPIQPSAALALRQRHSALVRAARETVRTIVPLPIRIERKRIERYPSWLIERRDVARARLGPEERRGLPIALATKTSPLRRGAGYERPVQRAKEINVRKVASLVNGVCVEPGQLFSYHHVIGRPSVLRGFAPGPELREGKLALGVGGGACQVSNMLFQLGLLGGMEVVERHRHGLDLFPDVGRDVPFGCGATVFYNMADLRLRNSHPFPLVWRLSVRDGRLLGALLAHRHLAEPIEVVETLHRFVESDGVWWRENRIVRRAGGRSEVVAHNLARTAYTPASLSAPCGELGSDPLVWSPERDRLCPGGGSPT